MQEFQHNSLLTNVNLRFGYYNLDCLPQFMAIFWPLFTNINSIKIEAGALDDMQCAHFDLAKPLLASARIIRSTLVFSCQEKLQQILIFFR
jgi:hypothetical protein